MDVVRDGPLDAKALLIVSSGCHGVEGFCGSGVQVALLRDPRVARRSARAPASPCSTSTALNPYGFSWWRRDDARERRPEPQLPRLRADRAGERALRRARPLPRAADWPPDAPRSPPCSTRFVAAHGERALQQAISGGQYAHPDGLFYGGRHPTWSHATLRHVLRDHGTRCARLAWIDLHTGLGPNGHGERIFAGRDDAAGVARAHVRGGAT